MPLFYTTVSLPGGRALRRALAITLASACWTSSVSAQALRPVGVVHALASTGDTLAPAAQTYGLQSDPDDLPVRLVLGLVGSFAGVYAGGAIGLQTAAGCHGEFCGFGSMLIGAAAGAAVVSALAEAIPKGSSTCGRAQRIGAALLGSTTGVLAGGVAGLVGGPLGVVVGAFSGSTIGSAVGANLCN